MFTIMGIDPGTKFLGAAALQVNTKEPEPFKLIYADTIRSDLNDFMVRNDTPHQTKAKGLIRVYGYLMDFINPDVVCCEDNFSKYSPATFKRLIEIVTMMSYCTLVNRPHVPFHLVLPRLAKKIVNADTDNGDKEKVKFGLMSSPLIDLNGTDLNKLTYDANDAILLAVYEAVQLYTDYGWIVKNKETKEYSFKL